MNKIKEFNKNFNAICKKNILVIIMILFLCPILGISYSSLVLNTSNYRASEMYIGHLLYSISIFEVPSTEYSTITYSSTNEVIVPANSEKTVYVKVTSLNDVSTKYKLVYQTQSGISVMYANDENVPTSGLILTESVVTLLITNSSSTSKTVVFNAIGGFGINEVSDIAVASGYSFISNDYHRLDFEAVAIYIDGELSSTGLDSTKYYTLTTPSSNTTGNLLSGVTNCTYGNVPSYNTGSKKLIISSEDGALTSQGNAKCILYFNERAYTYYNESKGVNAPVLATGMTPIKPNGSSWVDTTESDTDWYNYNTTDKKWANAKTADGSMWVWIPRYVYRISTDWHLSTTGTIDVQFSIDTDDTRDGTVTLDTGSTATASNNKWTNHPAFTFGTTELAGIWVAKFEPTASEGLANTDVGDNVTTKTVKILPNVQSWRYINIGNAYQVSRNMETNSVYGWGTSGNGIDTHLMKNSEWGAVAYLSKSTYGQNTNEIWINPANNYTTGCAGDNVSSSPTTECLRTYDTTNGVKASSTGTIYGIYDLSGGAWERVSAYVDNANANLATNGSQIMSADGKYKDVYTVGGTDDQANNYALTVNKKGDAVWETSNNINGSYSWFADYSYMPSTSNPWFARGGYYSRTKVAGAFNFGYATGNPHGIYSFRPVLVVNTGL